MTRGCRECCPSEQLGLGLRALAQEPAEHMPRVAAPSFFNSSIPVKPEDFAQPHGKKHLSAGSFPMHLLAFWVSVRMATFPYLPSGQSTHTPRREVSAASTPGQPPASGQKLHIIMRYCSCCFCGLTELELNVFSLPLLESGQLDLRKSSSAAFNISDKPMAL